MAGLSFLFILLALVISPTSTNAAPAPALPSSQPLPLPSFFYAGNQILIHIITGFAAGALSLDPAVALVGAAVGPLIDLDHLGFYAGLPIDARVGHSFLMVASIVLLDWRLHFWGRGTRNLFLFISLEFSVHLAVAPPGFPLFAPLSAAVVYFPSVVPAALAAVLAVAFFLDSTGRAGALRLRRSVHPATG